jgi:hypothetical protein
MSLSKSASYAESVSIVKEVFGPKMANEGADDYQPDPKKIEAFERLGKAIEESKKRNKAKPNSKSKDNKPKSPEEQEEERREQQRQAENKRIDAISKNIASFEEWQTNLLQRYEALHTTVANNLPSLWDALEFGLSVKTILNIKGCTLPFAGIILGPPSSLKTVVIELLKGRRNTFHSHNFSPKSFVSHSTAVKREDLPFVDLLPKLKNKLFLTPELAPVFAAEDKDLLQMLSILTSVLDGHGFESDTGAQGHRGYNEDIMFTWLGAVVDIPFRVHKQLSQLGPKLYFYRLPKIEREENYYFDQKDDDFTAKVQAISQALGEYLDYFDANPFKVFHCGTDTKNELPKIASDITKDEDLAHRYIIRLGMLLAPLRAVVPTWETRDTQGSEYAYAMAVVEDPSKAITQLRNLARAHALSQGRLHITVEDIPMLIKVVLSTCSKERQTIFETLIGNDGFLRTSHIVAFLNTTKPTALKTMTELKATGLVTMYDIHPQEYNSEKEICLKSEFDWFLSDDFRELALKGRISNNMRCKEKAPLSSTQQNDIDNTIDVEESSTDDSTRGVIEESTGKIVIPESIYRAYGDTWACKNPGCNVKGDKWFMLKHPGHCRSRSKP